MIINSIPDLSSRPKTEDAWVFAKSNAIQAVGVMSFGEYMVSKALSHYGDFCIMKKFHICVWRTDVLSFRLPISSILSSLCQHKIRHKFFSFITKIWFKLDKSLPHTENSLSHLASWLENLASVMCFFKTLHTKYYKLAGCLKPLCYIPDWKRSHGLEI